MAKQMTTYVRMTGNSRTGSLAVAAACSVLLLVTGMAGAAQKAPNAQQNSRHAQDQQQNNASNAQKDQGNQNDAFTIKPESLAFGQRPLFTSHTDSFWLKNKGKTPLKISKIDLQGANDQVFKVENNCGGSIPAEGECRINVMFEPTSAGDKTAEVRVVAGDNSVRTKQVTGNGVQAQFSVSTETVAFGKVARNAGSKPQTVTIKNTGTVALPITATSLGGPNEHQFSQSNDCSAELGVGKTCASTIVFRPTDEGQKTATLTVWAKGGAPEKKISITGTGASASG